MPTFTATLRTTPAAIATPPTSPTNAPPGAKAGAGKVGIERAGWSGSMLALVAAVIYGVG
jgi:hypothetical protein